VTIRPRTIVWGLALGLGFLIALIYGHPASATGQSSHQPAPCCTTAPEWYVNGDETALKPTQQLYGLLFDGPSLIHHAVVPEVALKDAPTDGAFGGHLFHGSMPLFKMETHNPYSTVNKTVGGYWSSKIATGPGSQASPVATLADLAALAPYGDTTTVYSFGVGYANDHGNAMLVSWISFGGHKYELKCPKPSPSPSASSPSPSVIPTTPGSPTPTQPEPTTPGATLPPTTDAPTPGPTTAAPTDTPTSIVVGGIGAPQGPLAKTGYNLAIPVGIGVSSIVAGVFLAVVAIRRRRSFVA
jgi:hypothetical protein